LYLKKNTVSSLFIGNSPDIPGVNLNGAKMHQAARSVTKLAGLLVRNKAGLYQLSGG
jgi:hypothetical protein